MATGGLSALSQSLSDKYTEWVHKRNRDRVMEVWSMYERHRNQLRELLVLDEGS